MSARAIVACMLACLVAATLAAAGPHDNCNFNAAVSLCQKHIAHSSRCEYFKCLVDHCPTAAMLSVGRAWCGHPTVPAGDDSKAPLVSGGMTSLIRDSKPRYGEDSKTVPLVGGDAELEMAAEAQPAKRASPLLDEASARRHLEANRMKHGVEKVALPQLSSPCHTAEASGADEWSRVKAQQLIHHACWAAYSTRAAVDRHHRGAHSDFSTDAKLRWSGIADSVCPSTAVSGTTYLDRAEAGAVAPVRSDASSFVTWVFWTVFGKGGDFVNGADWKAGNVQTLARHGKSVHVADLQVGDVCFYYPDAHHVAIFVGGGYVMSHGHSPLGYFKVDYAPIAFCRRYF